MELPLICPPMMLFPFQIFVFCSEVVYTLVPDADRVTKNLKASHSDCGAKTENTLYALNQERECHIIPEELNYSEENNSLNKVSPKRPQCNKMSNTTSAREVALWT